VKEMVSDPDYLKRMTALIIIGKISEALDSDFN